MRSPALGVLLLAGVAAVSLTVSGHVSAHPAGSATAADGAGCPADDTGLRLPPGFCATIFADRIGHARHLIVAPSGVVYVNLWSGAYFPPGEAPRTDGFLVALKDTTGSGRADVIRYFGETPAQGSRGGTGVAWYRGSIYAEVNDRIVRYAVPPGAIVPSGPPVTVVSGLPLGGDHPMHPFYIGDDGGLYIDVATATNACQEKNRTPGSAGIDPCRELETRGGIWRYDAGRTDQTFSPANRYATGIRNGEGFAFDPSARLLFVAQHGRDQLHANWPGLYQPGEEATLPSEEVVLLRQGGDYGWPECYYDPRQGRLVLAPEYGGDGGHAVGVCAAKSAPVAAFPAHWGPNAMTFSGSRSFPARYRDGVFIAFHGSWDRAPYQQGGYNVVFQPLRGARAAGGCEIFADGFAGPDVSPGRALHRPSGVAVSPEGALFVSDDTAGRIYRITYAGGAASAGSRAGEPAYTPCPDPAAPAGPLARDVSSRPPEGTHADAGDAANLPVPEGATREMVSLGDRIYHGQSADGTCTACHGADGRGTPLGPDLTKGQWAWSDGSWRGITRSITTGVPAPRQFRSPMPPLGGAELTPEQASAVGAYVWALSHRRAAGAQ